MELAVRRDTTSSFDPTSEGAISRSLKASVRWRWAETLFWAVIGACYFAFPRHLPIMNEIAVLALFALSLDLILGYGGIVSLGHAAFLGLGAYAAGLFALHVSPDPLLGLATAAFASAVLGLLTGPLLLRGSDLTRLMLTLAIALVLQEAANRLGTYTGGADGLQGISMGPILGRFEFDLAGRTAAAYSLVILLILFLVARRLTKSPFGLSVRAIRDNPRRAAALGVPVSRRIIGICAIAGAYAGVAGALLAQTTQFVSLDVFDFQRSADLILVLIIGGAGYLYGALIGAIIFKLMQDGLATLTPQYWQFWVGLLLVVFVLAGRERVGEVLSRLRRRLIGRPLEVGL
jgi:branched-chain amino acid transport system permease protein